MIIDDSISFFAVYYHNCILNLNLSKEFADLYSKIKYKNVLLCQKDGKGGYLMTQSVTEGDNPNPSMRSYYFKTRESLREGFKTINDTIESAEKTFYLLRSNNDYNMKDSEELINIWKKEVKDSIKIR
jgi:hypothetical protein